MANNKSSNTKLAIISELFTFLWRKKEWWLAPIVIALLILGVLLAFAQSSAIGPFMYTIF
jgi:LPS O-antigen subunit length determinant protein (WzzB/FepE family)